MKVLRKARLRDTVLTLGNFDGIHIGHQKILRKVRERARSLGCPSAVYTFEPHPLKVVAPHKSPPLILDLEDKKELIESFGIEFMILARFTKEFASKHPREFVEEELVKRLSVREIWVGPNYAFGRNKLGTVEYLKGLGQEFGFTVNVISPCTKRGMVVSSSLVRSLIKEGRMKVVGTLLGRPYSIKGYVIKGRDIGKAIGFPTANLKVLSDIIPPRGVYAGYTVIDSTPLPSVVNIGTAPTFGGRRETVEVHVLGFRDDIYGRKIRVMFERRLRDERRFENREELVRAIRKDIHRAERILKGSPSL